MVDAAPFRALRYDPSAAGDPASTSAPAYDDLEPTAYAHHRTASPYTVLELLTPSGTRGSHETAGAALRRWRRTGVLRRDATPAFYRYEEHELRHGLPAVQRGVLAAVALPQPGRPSPIDTHEAVDPARVADRLARLEALRVDVSPIVALVTDPAVELRKHLEQPPRSAPVAALTDEAGVDHRVWAVTDTDEIARLAAALRTARVLVADGHHRYAAALAARRRMPGEGWGRTLMYLVDAGETGPQVLGVHRLVRGVDERLAARLAVDFELRAADPETLRVAVEAAPRGVVGVLVAPPLAGKLGATAALLHPRDARALAARLPGDRPQLWRELDTAVLDHAVLPGVGAATVEYRADLADAAREVASSVDSALFVLRPVELATVAALAAAGERMPPKSTYFRPKPRAGLVLRPLDEVDPPQTGHPA